MLDGTSERVFLSRQRLWSTGIITSVVFPCSESSLYCRFSRLCTILAFLAGAASAQDGNVHLWNPREQQALLTVPLPNLQLRGSLSLSLHAAEITFPFLGHCVLLQFEEWVWGQSYKAMMSAPSRAVLFQGNLRRWLSMKKRFIP